MITVVGVRFKKAGKIYYFDPDHLDIQKEDNVIVETARGIEFGHVVIGKREVSDDEIVSPLKKVLRIATSEDVIAHNENKEKNCETFRICEEKIKAHELEMKLIDVEYTFDNNKVIFYFTADGRIDFRELVKDLASVFKTRIELRQIGVRDEAKMVNGIGPCGIGLCCANWLGDFAPVSIKMAKDQNLSLNPTKISGICGRLMCCLKYEHDTYQALRKGMPNRGDRVLTEEGPGVVFDTNILLEQVKVRHIVKERDESPELGEDVVIYKKHQIKSILKKSAHSEDSEELVIENIDDIPQELMEEINGELKQRNCGKKCGSKGGGKPQGKKPYREPLPEGAQADAAQRAKSFAKTVAVSDEEVSEGNKPADRPRDERRKNDFDRNRQKPRPEKRPKKSLEDFNGELESSPERPAKDNRPPRDNRPQRDQNAPKPDRESREGQPRDGKNPRSEQEAREGQAKDGRNNRPGRRNRNNRDRNRQQGDKKPEGGQGGNPQ